MAEGLPPGFERSELALRILNFAKEELSLPDAFYEPIVDASGSDKLSAAALERIGAAMRLSRECGEASTSSLVPIYGGLAAFYYDEKADSVLMTSFEDAVRVEVVKAAEEMLG